MGSKGLAHVIWRRKKVLMQELVAEDIEAQMAAGEAQEMKEEQAPDPADRLAVDDDAADVVDGAWDVLRRIRLLPGAATSCKDFQDLFAKLATANTQFQRECEPEVTDESSLIPVMVATHKARIAHLYPDASEYLLRLLTAAVAVLTLHTADVFLREHATVVWIIEGGCSMRFHHGDSYLLHPSGAFQQYKGLPLDCARIHAFLMHLEGLGAKAPITAQDFLFLYILSSAQSHVGCDLSVVFILD